MGIQKVSERSKLIGCIALALLCLAYLVYFVTDGFSELAINLLPVEYKLLQIGIVLAAGMLLYIVIPWREILPEKEDDHVSKNNQIFSEKKPQPKNQKKEAD
jgi:hypothetical protein